MKLYIERNGILIDTFTLNADVEIVKVTEPKRSGDGRYHRSIKLIVKDAPPPEAADPEENEEEFQPGGSRFIQPTNKTVQTNADVKGEHK